MSGQQSVDGALPPRRSRSRVLVEYRNTRQIAGESFRRWFSSRRLDLIVWYSPDNEISGFQLCYGEGPHGRALTWFRGKGYAHNRVDDGDDSFGGMKMTPILVPDGAFDRDSILESFSAESREIPVTVADFVTRKLEEYNGGDVLEAV
jgi:hypothetical protein